MASGEASWKPAEEKMATDVKPWRKPNPAAVLQEKKQPTVRSVSEGRFMVKAAAIDQITKSKGKIKSKGVRQAAAVSKGKSKGEAAPIDENPPPAAAAGGNGKHRLSDDVVRLILKLEREPLLGAEDFSFLRSNNPVKLSCFSQEWVEQTRQQYKEDDALAQKIDDDFEVFQTWVREEWLEKGYVEVDDGYLARVAEAEAEGKAEWAQREHFPGAEFADPDDPDYADWYY